MSGKLVVRRADGTVETIAVAGPIRIGSAAQSEVHVESDGVLPLHANAGFEGGEYWIRNAGNAWLAINGEPAVEKRTLRHLDVITVGSGVNVIFSTTAAALPAQPRAQRPAPPRAATVVTATPQATVVNRPEPAAPRFKPADADAGAEVEKTIIGSVPGVMPSFRAAETTEGTIIGQFVPGVAPRFQAGEADAPNTIMGAPSPAAPTFRPAESEPAAPNTIVGAAVPGVMPSFAAGSTVAPVTPNTLIQTPNSPLPKFSAAPPQQETISQPGMAAPMPTVRVKPTAAQRPITGVTLRGIGSVLKAPLGRSVIGRGTTATIRIDSAELSKVHAVLDVTATEVTLTDQKSVNGTAVNGAPTTGPRRLIEGDRVSFATFEFRVEFDRMDVSA